MILHVKITSIKQNRVKPPYNKTVLHGRIEKKFIYSRKSDTEINSLGGEQTYVLNKVDS